MKKIIRLTESDLTRIVKRVISEMKIPEKITIYTTNDTFTNEVKSENTKCTTGFQSQYGNEPIVLFNFSNLRKSSNCSLIFDSQLTHIHNCSTQLQSTGQPVIPNGGSFDCNTNQLNIKGLGGKEMIYNLHKTVTQGQDVLIDFCKSNFKDKENKSSFGKCDGV